MIEAITHRLQYFFRKLTKGLLFINIASRNVPKIKYEAYLYFYSFCITVKFGTLELRSFYMKDRIGKKSFQSGRDK